MVVVFLRWVIVAGILVPLQWRHIRAEWPLMRPYSFRMVLMAVFGFIGFNTLFYIAATETTAVNLGIIQGSVPILVLIGSMIAFGSRIRALQVIGILLTLAGVTLIAAQGSLDVLLALAVNPGDGVMLIACVLYSGYTLALRDRPRSHHWPSLRFCPALRPSHLCPDLHTTSPPATFSGRHSRAGSWSFISRCFPPASRRSSSCEVLN